MVEWIAFKNKEKIYSKDINFSLLNLDEITAFSLISKKNSIYVNKKYGTIILGNGETHDIENSNKLLYYKRAHIDFNSGEIGDEVLDYAVCGLKSDTEKLYIKINFPDDTVEIIREKI